MLTVTFSGLCGFAPRSEEGVNCFLHPGGGTHRPVLTAGLRAVTLNGSLPPDFVSKDERGDELGIWLLASRYVRLGASGGVTFENRNTSLDLATHHPNISVKDPKGIAYAIFPANQPESQWGAVIEMAGGTLTFPESPADKLRLKKAGGKHYRGRFPTSVRWEVDAIEIHFFDATGTKPAGKIAFRAADARVAITNVSATLPTREVTHFDHYYELVSLDGETPMTIERLDLDDKRDADVYDCVPPVPLA